MYVRDRKHEDLASKLSAYRWYSSICNRHGKLTELSVDQGIDTKTSFTSGGLTRKVKVVEVHDSAFHPDLRQPTGRYFSPLFNRLQRMYTKRQCAVQICLRVVLMTCRLRHSEKIDCS